MYVRTLLFSLVIHSTGNPAAGPVLAAHGVGEALQPELHVALAHRLNVHAARLALQQRLWGGEVWGRCGGLDIVLAHAPAGAGAGAMRRTKHVLVHTYIDTC